MEDLKWLVEHGWTELSLSYWPADEEDAAKWYIKANKSMEKGSSGYTSIIWQWGTTPEEAVAGLRARAERLDTTL